MFVREVESGARAALRVLSFSTRLVTTPPEMSECNVGRCHDQYPDVGQLAAHRILDHDARPGQALHDARALAGFETVPPTFADLSGLRDTFGLGRPKEIPFSRLAPRIVVKRHAETRPRSHKANPAGCRTCLRFAPEKCFRHGGPSRSTSFRGDGARRRKYESARVYVAPVRQ